MIAQKISELTGLSDTAIKGVMLIGIALVTGLLTAYFPGAPWLPPVAAALAAVALLIDPNVSHAPG